MALFAALTAAGAFIRIPAPLGVFTLQLLFTTLAGLLLGARKGAASVGCYIVLGLIGLPIFASGGGIFYVLEPSFGYIIGFAVGAFVTGAIAKSGTPSFLLNILAAFAGLVAVYVCGMAYNYVICNFYTGAEMGVRMLFLYSFVELPGDIALCLAAAAVAESVTRLLPGLRAAKKRKAEKAKAQKEFLDDNKVER